MKNRYSALVEKITNLKKSRGAIILAHNYQAGEVQDIADFVGDSLELSQNAANTSADVIVFCGVYFMAETASILCPDKTVLLPDKNAGCPMANMINKEQLKQRKRDLPEVPVVCYVNSSADVKAESDICCTSANAVKVVESLDTKEVLFIPDQYLGNYVATKTRIRIMLWPGFCPTHMKIKPQDITNLRLKYPQAKVIVHPECKPAVISLAHEVLGTGGMLRFSRQTEAKEIIIGTEINILHRLKKENPDKTFIPAFEQAVCPNMKLITLEKVLWSLQELTPVIKVEEEIRVRAKVALDKMLAASGDRSNL